jgi:hypothetical protein
VLHYFTTELQAADQNKLERLRLEFEAGPVWQSKNDVRIPGNSGTSFSFKDLTGTGPYASGRLSLDWNIRERHGLRFLVAPLQIEGTGTFDQSVDFAGTTFAPGVSTKGRYKFNTYRFTYSYLFLNKSEWRLRAGGTLLVRDAKIELEQNGLKASDSNVGIAPLLFISCKWDFAQRWTAILDFDGLAGGPGRALDLALKVSYALTDHWNLGAGYRMLEGGVDNDDVYNFSWFNYGFLTIGYRF